MAERALTASEADAAVLTGKGFFKRFSYTAPREGKPQDGAGSAEVWDREDGEGWLTRVLFGLDGQLQSWRQAPGAIGANSPHGPIHLLDSLKQL